MKQYLNCPHCTAAWKLPRTPYGGYEHEQLKALAAEAARHLRDEHGDEKAAIRMEAWAVKPAPGAGEARPT